MKKCKFYRVDFWGLRGPRDRGPKNGPSPSLLELRVLRGLCNLLIIECMNKFEHNINFVTKTLTFEGLWFSCFRRSQRQGPKNGPFGGLGFEEISLEVYAILQ